MDNTRKPAPRRMPDTSNAFEACRDITAAEVAHHHGLPMQRKNGRLWACCPLHREQRPSLLMDARGRWHCFGCGRGGDGVDLHAQMKGISLYAAALELMSLLRPEWYGPVHEH